MFCFFFSVSILLGLLGILDCLLVWGFAWLVCFSLLQRVLACNINPPNGFAAPFFCRVDLLPVYFGTAGRFPLCKKGLQDQPPQTIPAVGMA